MKKLFLIILISSIAFLACTENKNDTNKKIDPTLLIELNHKMILAARSSDFNAIDRLLKEGADINYKDSIAGFTLLTNAIFYKNIQSSKYLIEKGADINLPARHGVSPLMMAIQVLDMDLVKLLIDKGADINALDEDGRPSLYYAIHRNNAEDIFKYLILNKAKVNVTFILRKNLGDFNEKGVEKTLVQFAKDQGKNVLADLLIAAGAK